MTTVIYHSADFDGIFCREIARKFIGNEDVNYIGWNFGDAPIPVPADEPIYIMDLPADEPLGFKFSAGKPIPLELQGRITWIDHHGTSIASHPTDIAGYRIDGVAACRLAWQWFAGDIRPCECEQPHPDGHYDYCPRGKLPYKQEFIARKVIEPLAVRLAGEYDIWDDWRSDWDVMIEFQFGLRSCELTADIWHELFTDIPQTVHNILDIGRPLHKYQRGVDASVVNFRSFIIEFEGLKFLTLNTARCNSLTFAARDVRETGHDALCGFYWNGKEWSVSLYHAKHRKDLDLSKIAVKHGGGGHKGACGFAAKSLPWVPTAEAQ